MSGWVPELIMLAIAGVALLIFWSDHGKGLPLLSSPFAQRALIAAPCGLVAIYFIDYGLSKDSNWSLILTLFAYGAVPAWLMFGGLKADKEWKQSDAAERERIAVEAERQKVIDAENDRIAAEQQKLAGEERERTRELDEINAGYAPLGDRTLTPDEITEHARRVAEELKKGV